MVEYRKQYRIKHPCPELWREAVAMELQSVEQDLRQRRESEKSSTCVWLSNHCIIMTEVWKRRHPLP